MILMGSTAVIETVCGGNINTNGDNSAGAAGVAFAQRAHAHTRHFEIEINLFYLMSDSLRVVCLHRVRWGWRVRTE